MVIGLVIVESDNVIDVVEFVLLLCYLLDLEFDLISVVIFGLWIGIVGDYLWVYDVEIGMLLYVGWCEMWLIMWFLVIGNI